MILEGGPRLPHAGMTQPGERAGCMMLFFLSPKINDPKIFFFESSFDQFFFSHIALMGGGAESTTVAHSWGGFRAESAEGAEPGRHPRGGGIRVDQGGFRTLLHTTIADIPVIGTILVDNY